MTQKEYYDFREEENTRQVSFLQLVRNLLKSWKLILLAGVILGCVFGAYKILSIHSQKDAMIEEYDTYKSKLDAYKKSIKEYKESVEDLQNRIDARIDYIASSPKMNLNAYNAPSAICEIKFSNVDKGTLKQEDFTMIKTALYNEIYVGQGLSTVAEKYGVPIVELREYILAKTPSVGSAMRIIVHYNTEEESDAMLDDILAVLDTKIKELTKTFGNFKYEVYNRSTQNMYDADVISYQDKQNDALSDLQTASYTAQNQSTNLIKPNAVQQYSKKYMLKSGIKMGIIGLIGGCILAAAVLMLMMIQKGVILNAEEIDGEFGLRKLGDFSERKGKEAGKAMDYVAARLENCVGEKSDLEIGVVGLADEKHLDSITGKLNEIEKGSSRRMKFVHLPNLLGDASSLRNLRNVDGVILVEEVGRSEFLKVKEEIALIADSGREILGTVYF